MSDRIVVDTDQLAWCIRELKNLSDKTDRAASQLRRIDFTNCGSGDVRVSGAAMLKCSGRRITGGNVLTALSAYASGLTDVGDSATRLAQTVQTVWECFEAAEEEIKRLVEGDDPDAVFAYEPQYSGAAEMVRQKTPEWEAQDTFINTAYDKRVKEALAILLLNDPAFSEEGWKACDTPEKKAAYLKRAMDKISEVMGTELNGGIYFTSAKTGTVGKVEVTINGTKYNIELSDTAGAAYYNDLDCIVVRTEGYSFSEIIATICHENRHNMQKEVSDTTDLANSKYVLNPDEYDAIAQEAQDWREEYAPDGYFTYDTSDIRERAEEIRPQLSWIERTFTNNAYNYAQTELHEDYAEQSVEVDARYMENYAYRLMQQRIAADNADGRNYVRSRARGGGGGGGGRR